MLLKRLIESESLDNYDFTNKSYFKTIGVDFKRKVFEMEKSSIKCCINFFDTSGADEFRDVTKSYLQNVQAFIVCYDCNDAKSFNNCKYWNDELNKLALKNNLNESAQSNEKHLIKILVGCKNDLTNPKESQVQVSTKTAKQFAKKNGFLLQYETSAKDNLKIKELFDELCMELISNYINFLNFQRLTFEFISPDTGSSKSYSASKNQLPLTALTTKTDVYFSVNDEILNCNHIIINNANSKRKNLQAKGFFDFFD